MEGSWAACDPIEITYPNYPKRHCTPEAGTVLALWPPPQRGCLTWCNPNLGVLCGLNANTQTNKPVSVSKQLKDN